MNEPYLHVVSGRIQTKGIQLRGAMEDEKHISLQVRSTPKPLDAAGLYVDLLKRTLSRVIIARKIERHTIAPGRRWLQNVALAIHKILGLWNLELVRLVETTAEDYLESGDAAKNRAEDAETMLGIRQLDHMQSSIQDILDRDVPGDLVEAGVWRGGMTILMRAILKARGETTRRVWVVDSFSGLPDPDAKIDSHWWKRGDMAVSLQEVQSNFARYGLLDNQVVFVKGFFADSLPGAQIPQISVLRIDADLYQSTLDALEHLYPKLSVGGYAIFDDYQNLSECRRAIDEYREKHDIEEPVQNIDSRAVYWIKK